MDWSIPDERAGSCSGGEFVRATMEGDLLSKIRKEQIFLQAYM
jgi:hypothetical protein